MKEAMNEIYDEALFVKNNIPDLVKNEAIEQTDVNVHTHE